MKFHQLFKAALHEPKKLAAFRLLPLGKVVKYIFMFVLLTAAVSFVKFALTADEVISGTDMPVEELKGIGPLLYPAAFVLQFLIATVYFYVKASIAALAGLGFVKIRGKRGEYRHLWRTAAISLTVPTLILMAANLLPAGVPYASALSWAAAFVYIWMAVGYYPKAAPKKRTAHNSPSRS
ncbi:DUF1189 family protein [Bhargavaea ullalensis]|uniref:DUF1189 domain-containing protein n=1 Tax=Bhargavaea ullalensis TaxID=1265685 RepID=A0ABV2G913_9BACL